VTVNSATLYDFIAQNRPEVIAALQTAIAEPGPHIQQAVNAFTAAVASGHRKVDKCSISGLLLEAYSRAESEAVAEDARGLVANAVFRSRELSALEREVEGSGIFDRELSEGDFRVASLDGFLDFDPATAAGRGRWIQLQRILTVYFSKPGNKKKSEKKAEKKWRQLQVQPVSKFIPMEKKAFRLWKQAGGDITDSSRIKIVKKRFGKELKSAYKSYKRVEAANGDKDDGLEKDWGKFCKVLEKVGRALEDEDSSSSDESDAVDQQSNRTAGRKKKTTIGAEECLEYFCLGTCTYGARCKYGHDGVENSKRLEVADGDDNCLQYLKYGNCRRKEKGNCPLVHDPGVLDAMDKDERPAPGMLTSDQHSAVVSYAEANSLDASKVSWETVKADGGLGEWLKPKKDSMPKVFPVLKPRVKVDAARGGIHMAICAAQDEEY